ncbi:hypothetical protein AAZX31_06G194500 [Glycine max]
MGATWLNSHLGIKVETILDDLTLKTVPQLEKPPRRVVHLPGTTGAWRCDTRPPWDSGGGIKVTHGGGALASSKNERRKKKKKEEKRRMTECENTKKRSISSCTDPAGDHGAHRRDEQ